MADPLSPIRRGDPLPKSAAFFRAVSELARIKRAGPRMTGGGVSGPALERAIIVTAVNKSTHAYEPFQPVHLGPVMPTADQNLDTFQSGPAYEIYSTVSDQACRGNWGIALNGIPARTSGDSPVYQLGRVLLAGVTVAKVSKYPGTEFYVDTGGTTDSADNYKLATRGAGAGHLLWIDPELEDYDEGWGVVHVLGYRVAEPNIWAILDDDLYRPDHETENAFVTATVKYAVAGSRALASVAPTRQVAGVICRFLTGNQYLAEGTIVDLGVEPYGGLREVKNALACPLTPEE